MIHVIIGWGVNMKRKIYFAGSIRGGRADAQTYHEMIDLIKETDLVLTEHVGDMDYSSISEEEKDRQIYETDTAWLRECDLVIAECTNPSLGVGYELAYAEKHNKPAYVFWNSEKVQLSAMIAGNPYYHLMPYINKEELFAGIRRILA